jgi:hypothetical protein
MPKWIVAVEGWGDATNYFDWYLNRSFEMNPYETVGNIFGVDYKRTVWVNSIQDMVDKVLSAAGNGKISHLTILGHGFPGWQSIGCGKDLDPTDTKHLYVENTGKLAGNADSELARLKPILSQTTIVSLQGCETGKGKKGELLLKTVSGVLGGVAVQAGTTLQRGMAGFEGPVCRCTGNICVTRPASIFE